MTTDLKSPSGMAIMSAATIIAAFIGYGVGAGEWKGKVNQILEEHERRLNLQDARDDRQDDHMAATDRTVNEIKTTLATINYQVGYLVRRLQNGGRFGDSHRGEDSG